MNFTKHTLKKIEELFGTLDYELIYGKGNFQSGYCIVQAQKKIVINRYYETEARINSLIEIITQIECDESLLNEKEAELLKSIFNHVENVIEDDDDDKDKKGVESAVEPASEVTKVYESEAEESKIEESVEEETEEKAA